MSDIVGELARVRSAFETPTLTLLHKANAAVIIAVFRTAFSRDLRSVPAGRLQDQVETYLGELRLAGVPDVPTGSGRDLCLRWMRDQWLVRDTGDDGTETYSLTSHAQDALSLVKRLTQDRANLSEHRIATIVNVVRRFNSDVNPDRAARVAILDSEIARLSGERDRILAGGILSPISDDYLLEGFAEILDLIGNLPGDFSRVEERFTALRSEILESFRADQRPAGEVIDEYLRSADTLMLSTPEGRAFEGAFALLRDESLLLQLREDLSALLAHPRADDILRPGDRRDLRGAVSLIRGGIDQVLNQRARVSGTLRDYIVTHDISRDRELDTTLADLERELVTWMRTAGPRTSVPLQMLPMRADVNHLRQKFYNAAEDAVPPPLVEVSDHEPEPLTLTDLLTQGGPSIADLERSLLAALDGDGPARSVGEVFNDLDAALRRPVEIFGLLHLAANLPGVDPDDGVDTYRTRRPGGMPRNLHVPRYSVATRGGPRTDPQPERDRSPTSPNNLRTSLDNPPTPVSPEASDSQESA